MDRKKRVSLLVAGLLVLGAAFGAVTYQTVYAQDVTPATPTPATPNTPNEPQQALPNTREAGRGRLGVTQADLATALGITVEKLQTAQQTAQAAALKQAVEAGLLTQAQADAIAARGFGEGMMGKMWGRFLNGSEIDYDALLADALNISVDELQQARITATNAALDQAVADGMLTQEQADLMKARQALANDEAFQTNMRTAYEAALAQAVQDGVITQAQADALLAESQGMLFHGWGGMGGGHHDFGHGRGGMHGGWQFSPDSDDAPTTPSSNNDA